jgi:hypothetical protein
MTRICCLLAVLMPLAFAATDLAAQATPAYAVIDGTQNPPQILFSDVNIQISDGGAGDYTLTFETPVVFLLGTSRSRGLGFDAYPNFLSAVRNSADRRQVNISIYGIPFEDEAAHGRTDAVFSLKFMLAPQLIFGNGFE